MNQPNGSREHDIVLFGATGFTGALTAEYLAKNAPDGCRWALAGRNRGKLEAVRARLAEIDPSLADLPLLQADVTDRESLRAVAESARVVITTVGPYIEYGEPLVVACADAGTDYVDLTGEPEFADRMYVAHHERAKETGARIVHACGLDSIPHDLGVWFTVQQLPEGVPLWVRGMLRAGGRPSGGTFASEMPAFSRTRQMRQEGSGHGTSAAPGQPHRLVAGAAAHDRPVGGEAVGRGPRAVRPRLRVRPLRRGEAAARGRSGRRGHRRARRSRAGAPAAAVPAQPASPGGGTERGAAGEVVVQDAVRR